ncbi:hypothetical protein [Aquimarina mytili]|uniref:Uncharacterized protein n=1 Tax=Aquimarina mytili TaxID=874423 RepID=A0A937A7F7_9FLAO|nr:hypothetical protein [Aquimarina mytili]MBL0685639.1 hypothetical protein [Aquimarina mytili]
MKNNLVLQKTAITFSVVLYAIVVPYLEINNTHVFNPDWTPHVRIHEVWQLFTNTSIGVLCLWLVWKKSEVLLSSILSMIITGSFLVAFALQDTYGGSMKFLDGSEKTILGINIGVVGFGLAFILLVVSLIAQFKNNKKA